MQFHQEGGKLIAFPPSSRLVHAFIVYAFFEELETREQHDTSAPTSLQKSVTGVSTPLLAKERRKVMQPQQDPSESVTVKEAARRIGYSTRQTDRFIEKGQLE